MDTLSSDIQEQPLRGKDNMTEASQVTLLECGIGGCSFGAFEGHIIKTDSWQPEILRPIPHAPQGIMGTIAWGGEKR